MKKKRIEVVLFVIAIIAFISVITVVLLTGFVIKTKTKRIDFRSSNPPDVAVLNLETPADDAKSKIDFSVSLYDRACENWKQLDNAAMNVKSENEMMGVSVFGYRHIIKNLEEYYYTEYSHIPEGGNPLMTFIIGSLSAESTKFAYGMYTDHTMEQMYARRAIDPVPEILLDEEGNRNDYNVNWENAKDEVEEKVIYNKNQTEKYMQTELIISRDTVLSATVKKVEPKKTSDYEEGEEQIPMAYWELVLELDPAEEKATKIVLPRLRNGAGDNAYYSKLIETIQIWDNGYFKYFKAEDTWGGGFAGAGTTLVFETFFKYGKEDCNVNNYQHMAELKDIAHAAKASGKVR